ncbi:MAG: hypothetical protein Q7R35_17845 [Elusimicrobiota bacterium]|nr:hypothetical protein [Elusimicrobiota bacterium]
MHLLILLFVAAVALCLAYFLSNYLALRISRATGWKVLPAAIRVLGTFILTYLAYLALGWALFGFYFRDPSPLPFDPAQWKAADAGTSNTRYRMRDDLLQQHKLIGMTKTKLYELLGTPANELADGLSAVYLLGPDPGALGMDGVWLRFHFMDGRVNKYEYEFD